MTVVVAVMRRSYSPAMFDDLGLPPHTRAWDKPTALTTLTFDGELTDEQVSVVWSRMESTDAADMARRTALRAKRAAVVANPTLLNVAALGVANANYQLGD